MAWFANRLKRVSENAVRDYFNSDHFAEKLRDIIADTMRNDPRLVFVKAMQLEMLRVDPKMDYRQAWRIAMIALREWLDGEKIAFGDDRYDWSEDAAIEIIREMEIDHWETAP